MSGMSAASSSLREALAAWQAAGAPDPAFADDLERVAEECRASGSKLLRPDSP